MQIAIFGSLYEQGHDELPLKGTLTEFAEACRQIGAAIASTGHTVLVMTDQEATAEKYVVEGIVEHCRHQHSARPLIRVFPSGETVPFEDLARQHPDLFLFETSISERWRVVHLLTIQEADAALAIGGSRGTYDAGIAALISKTRLVPVGGFGGAGAKLLGVLDLVGGRTGSTQLKRESRGSLAGPWSERQLQVVVKELGLHDFPRLMIFHGRSNDWQVLHDMLINDLQLPTPIIMGHHDGFGKTLPSQFEELAVRIDGAIALASGDDLACAALDRDGREIPADQRVYQVRARQNVWLEVGWIWGAVGLHKVMILSKGEVEIPSDLQGIKYYGYRDSVQEVTNPIKGFINSLWTRA